MTDAITRITEAAAAGRRVLVEAEDLIEALRLIEMHADAASANAMTVIRLTNELDALMGDEAEFVPTGDKP